MPTIDLPPAFALLFTAVTETSSGFIQPPPDAACQANVFYHATAYRQDKDGTWPLDMAFGAETQTCRCGGAIGLFPAIDGDCRQRVMTAYQHYGQNFLQHIDGEFAFALADTASQTIILARDRFGAQPLYYAIDGEALAIANSLAGLCHLLRREPAINAGYMFDFLARNVPEPDHTIYQGIYMLPPGHFLLFQAGSVRVKPYWQLEPDMSMTAPKDPAAALRELIIASIRKRLPDAGKIILELSGGLDSSALLGFLTGIVGPERLIAVTRAFAAAYRGKQRDELAYAEDAARHCAVPLVVVDKEVTNPLPALEKYFDWMGNVSPNPYYDISTPMNRRMAALGAETVMAGVGGDEGVSLPGDIALPQLFAQGRWLALWRTLGAISKVYGHSRWKLFRHWLLPKLPPAWLDDGIAMLRLPEETRLQRLVLLRGDVRRAIDGGKKKYQMRHERMMAKEIGAGVLGPLFVQTGEIVQFFAWQHGLHFIHPFLDKDILAYTVALPPETFLMDGWRRGLFRRAIADAVPKSIAERRTKSPFSLPFPLYIRAAEAMIMDMCHQANHPAWDYLDRRALAVLTRRVCREKINHQIELAAVVVGKTAAMAMFLANRQRYWREKK